MIWRFRLCFILIFSLFLASCLGLAEEQPDTIVCINFDDAHSSVYEYALPILSSYGFKATNFVNSGMVGGPQNMSWAQIQSLEHDYGWETGGHSLNHANLATLSYMEAQFQISEDKRLLTEHGLNPRAFALPYGICPLDYYELIKKEYDCIRSSNDFAMYAPVDPQNLGYFPFQQSWNADTIKARILKAVANREALVIIGFHRVETFGGGYYDNCPALELDKICRWLHESGLRVMPLSQALDSL